VRLPASLLMLVVSCGVTLADAPRRVVSFNLCADQLVLALADPEQIAGLSPYAADASVSVMTEKAGAYPRLAWQAESTIALGPDLVLIGDSDRPVTKHILRAQGLRLHEITLIADLDTARRQVTEVAAVLGHPERGQKLIAEIEAARARLHAAPKPHVATALLVNRGGYTAGERSLAGALLAEAGLKPPAGAPPGYGGYVQLEKLLMLHPDVKASVAAVDEEAGNVLLWMNFGDTNSYGPGNALITFEAFNVWGGEIHAINAFFRTQPFQTQRGWPSAE